MTSSVNLESKIQASKKIRKNLVQSLVFACFNQGFFKSQKSADQIHLETVCHTNARTEKRSVALKCGS